MMAYTRFTGASSLTATAAGAMLMGLLPLAAGMWGCVGSSTDGAAPHMDAATAVDASEPLPTTCSESVADELYRDRIAPLMDPEHVDSCNRCHFTGVELRNYVRDTPCATMACLVESGAVDLESPIDSPVLALIERGRAPQGVDSLVTAEHDAFLAWIQYSAGCMNDVCPDIENPCGGSPASALSPAVEPETLLAGCTEAELTASFESHVFAQNDRCAHCHATDAPLPPVAEDATPQWMAPPTHPDAARLTMYNLLALGAIDGREPRHSRLLLKPLSPELGGVEHGGGWKVDREDDPWFQGVVAFATHYGRCSGLAPEETP